MEKSKEKAKAILKIKKITLWQAAAVILGIFLIVSMSSDRCDKAVSSEEAGSKAVSFISLVLLEGTKEAVLKSVDEEANMYKINFEVDGQVYPSYVSSDGKLLFLQPGIDMDEIFGEANDTGNTDTGNQDLPKTEKPAVELFVMSHCPFGTQVEKGMLPVANLLGDNIDFSVKFVYYAMHDMTEIDEQLLQHCIQEEFKDEYIDYLSCFLREGNTEECLDETGIDEEKLNDCIQKTDDEFNVTGKYNDKSTWLNGRYPLFDVNKDLNERYGVGGSPHLVINGVTSKTGRDPASLLGAVCASFSKAPEECSTELSSATPSPGFGFESTGGNSAGSCS